MSADSIPLVFASFGKISFFDIGRVKVLQQLNIIIGNPLGENGLIPLSKVIGQVGGVFCKTKLAVEEIKGFQFDGMTGDLWVFDKEESGYPGG